jgi:hypothetical protein
MNLEYFFYKLYLLNQNNEPIQYLGSAFPIVPNGGFLTCKHVVDLEMQPAQHLGIYDNEEKCYKRITEVIRFSQNNHIDLAYIPNALQRAKNHYLPILQPNKILIGEDCYTFGHYTVIGDDLDVHRGYFSGKIINIFNDKSKGGLGSLALPFPVIEGLSGSPLLTYHSGVKLVGVCHGNQAHRKIISEVIEYEDATRLFRESVNRIVEFGLAFHPLVIIGFLAELGIAGFTIADTNTPVNIEGLQG